MGSTGLGTSSASKQVAPFQHANAKPKATSAPAPPAARDGHVMGMHPKPSKKAPAAGGVAPGTVQELMKINKDLVASNVAGPPVTFATASPQEVKYKATPAPVPVSRVETSAAAEADQEQKPKSILGLLKKQLQITPPVAATSSTSTTSASSSSSSDVPLPRNVQASRVSSSMGGFRILRRTADSTNPAAADGQHREDDDEEKEVEGTTESVMPPAPPPRFLEPVVPSDGTGRAALALAAGLDENSLPPLPEAPLEHPMAGVIQINTFAKPISKPLSAPNPQSLKSRGFFSSGSPSGEQRPPSPLKKVLQRPLPTSEDGEENFSLIGSKGSDTERPSATASVAEKLAFAKKILLRKKASLAAAGSTKAASAVANAEVPTVSPTSMVEIEEASATGSGTPVPAPKLLVPMALLRKAAVDKK